MAEQSNSSTGGERPRSPFVDPPGLYDIIAAEEKRLGIGDENQALTQDQKEAILDSAYASIATSIGRAVKDAKDIRWVVEKFVARGGLYMLAGNPKRSKKSLLCLELCLSVSRGTAFLGLAVPNKLKAIFANFEDGYERCARRLRDFGVAPDTLDEVDLVTSRGGFAALCVWIKWRKPPFVVLDPMVEIEQLLGCRDENRSDQVAKLLGDLRELVRSTGTALFLPHHLSRERQNIRGSSAFEAAIDGWFIVRQPTKDGPLVLECTNRDCQDMRIEFSIEFTGKFVRVQALGPPEFGPLPEYKAKQGGDSKAAGYAGPSEDVARGSLLLAMLNSASGLSRDERRAAAGVRTDRLTQIQSAFLQEGLIEQKGRKFVLTARGTERAAQYRTETESRKPKALESLLADDGDGETREPSNEGSEP